MNLTGINKFKGSRVEKLNKQVGRFGCINYASPTDSEYIGVRERIVLKRDEVIRQEVTEVVFAGPSNGITPTLLGRLCDNLIIYFKRQVDFFLKSDDCLVERNNYGINKKFKYFN